MAYNLIPTATDAPPGTQPTLRVMAQRIEQLERDRLSDASAQTATDKGQAATLSKLAEQINALPVPYANGSAATGFGLSAGWNTYATVTLVVPAGKTKVNIFATGGAAIVDTTSGGLTTSYGRIVIGGNASVQYAAAKDAGSTAVNNILTMTHALEASTSPGATITVTLQLNPLNPSAFPSMPGNYASINVIAMYSS